MASNYIIIILIPAAALLLGGLVLVIVGILGYRAGDATGRRFDKWFV